MRKYYADMLQKTTNYRRNMRNVKLKHQMLIGCSIDVARGLKLEHFDESLPFFIASVSFPVDMKKILMKAAELSEDQDNQFEVAINTIKHIEKAMARFSSKALDNFMSIPEMSMLLLHYLKLVENSEYQEHYQMLKSLAEEKLNEQKKVNGNEGQLLNKFVRDTLNSLLQVI